MEIKVQNSGNVYTKAADGIKNIKNPNSLPEKFDEIVLHKKQNTQTDTKQNQPKKFDKNTAAKVLIGIGIIAAAGFAIYKGKQIKTLKEIPSELKPLFQELKGKNGTEFVDDAYSGLVKYMDLEGIAPAKVTFDGAGAIGGGVRGGYNQIDNTIQYSKNFLTNLTKKQQFNMLSHELTHCKQFNQILRTEGLGAEAVAKATAESACNNGQGLFGNFRENVMKNYPKEQAEKIIKEKIDEKSQEFTVKIKENFKKTLEMPKFSATSPEGLKAKEYLEAQRNYHDLGFLGITSKEYYENILEKEAYSFGGKMEKYFGAASSLPDRIKEVFRVLKNS